MTARAAELPWQSQTSQRRISRSTSNRNSDKPVTAKFAKECGTDAYGANAPEAVKICRQWIEEKRAR